MAVFCRGFDDFVVLVWIEDEIRVVERVVSLARSLGLNSGGFGCLFFLCGSSVYSLSNDLSKLLPLSFVGLCH